MYEIIPKPITGENIDLASSENKKDIVQERSWDSGEDHYFRWAPSNRRPIESLVGKKREEGRVLRGSDYRRINNGVWRSGLVG